MSLVNVTFSSLASGASGAPQASPDGRSTEFVAVENGNEQYSGGNLLVAAYAFVWVLLMGWIFLLWRKQQALGTRIDGLEAAIDRAAASRQASEPKARAKAKAPSSSGATEGETTA